MAEQEGDFIDALPGEQSRRGQRVPERVDRGARLLSARDRFVVGARVVQDREGWLTSLIRFALLRFAEGASDIALPERAAGPRSEHGDPRNEQCSNRRETAGPD
jgi:hypothetical protein